MKFLGKALLILGAGLVLLIAVLLARTGLLTSRQLVVDPAPSITVDQRAVAERLAGALRFQTISNQDSSEINDASFLRLHDYLV